MARWSRIPSLPIATLVLLPDGGELNLQSVLNQCYPQGGQGLLVFDPETSICAPAELMASGGLPDDLSLEQGVLIFDASTQEFCLPDECVVMVAAGDAGTSGEPAPPDPVFSDRFELLVPQI